MNCLHNLLFDVMLAIRQYGKTQQTLGEMSMNDEIEMQFVEKFEDESIYTFIHQDKTLFLVGDYEVVGDYTQTIMLDELAGFISLQLVLVDDSLEKIREHAKDMQHYR